MEERMGATIRYDTEPIVTCTFIDLVEVFVPKAAEERQNAAASWNSESSSS